MFKIVESGHAHLVVAVVNVTDELIEALVVLIAVALANSALVTEGAAVIVTRVAL